MSKSYVHFTYSVSTTWNQLIMHPEHSFRSGTWNSVKCILRFHPLCCLQMKQRLRVMEYVWSEDNPHATVTRAHQVRFVVNVWTGVVGDCLIGPYLLPRPLNGRHYHNYLSIALPELLEDGPFPTRQRMGFQHDGAPAHFSRPVRRFLNRQFAE